MDKPSEQYWECASCTEPVDSRYSPVECFNNPTGDVLCEACLEDLKTMYHMTPEELDEALGEKEK